MRPLALADIMLIVRAINVREDISLFVYANVNVVLCSNPGKEAFLRKRRT